MKRLLTLSLMIAAIGSFSPRAFAAGNDGQADLDKATEKKLSAISIEDLSDVIALCETAMKKGLDTSNTQFADDLYTSTLMQRATIFTQYVTEHSAEGDPLVVKARAAALADLEKVIGKDPKAGAADLMIAKLQQIRGGDHDRALKAAEKAVELTKDDANLQAAALVIRGNLEADAKKKEADYDAAIKLTPSDPDALWSRAVFLGDAKKYEAALADVDTLLKIGTQAKRPQLHIARGALLFELKRNDEAMHSFDQAIRLEPGSADPYVQRARIRAELKDNKGAIEDLNTALQLEPDNLWALLTRARVYQESGDLKHAKEDIDSALKNRPGDVEALELRAALFAKEKKYGDAIKDLEELTKIAPNNPELNLQLGLFYMADKQSHKAIEKFNIALAADSKNETTYAERGSAYLNLGKHAEAIHDYEQALKLKPDDSELQNNFAWVLCTSPDAKLRDGKRAVELAKQAAEASEYKEAYILSTLAAAYAETGDFDTAIKWSTKAVEVGDPKDKEELEQELNSYKNKKPWREQHDEDAENAKLKEGKAPANADANTAQKPEAPAADTQTK
ncbi:MAG TPA: tetratricopeptide repeat protein [Pirellulales bacterium]|jgi:tetratricopeptide (TPR) repeat protein|nr:tetratricopeptide repeat protein [Pirellulales bacterium]